MPSTVPFTRVLISFREHLYLRNYLAVNRLEAIGFTKRQARAVYFWNRGAPSG